MAATSPLICSVYSSKRGSGHARSPVVSPAVWTSAIRSSSLPISPEAWSPRATWQAPVSVGGDDLDGLARVELEHVAGLVGVPAWKVLRSRDEGDDVEREPKGAHGLHRPEHRGAPAHVELHVLHPARGLDGDAAGIEGHGLADEDDGSGVPAFAVLEHYEARRVRRRPADSREPRESLVLDAGPVEYRHPHSVPLGDLTRLLRQELGGGHVRGLVGEVPGKGGAPRGLLAGLGAFDGLSEVSLLGDEPERIEVRVLRA